MHDDPLTKLSTPDCEKVADALADDRLLDAVTGIGGLDLTRTHPLFSAVAARIPGCAGAHVAVARCREAAGELLGMERSLRRALQADPGHRPAHADLADLAALRNDGRATLRHLERAGKPAIGLGALVGNLGWGPVRGERNQPCPCGSGVRYKRCCLPTDGWPLRPRVQMLPTRLATWVERPVWLRRRLAFAAAVAGSEELERLADVLIAPGMLELFLYETGAIGVLLDAVAPVLRADEREVVRRWRSCRHDLYEVVDAASCLTLLNSARTGEEYAVDPLDEDVLEGSAGCVLAVVLPGPFGCDLLAGDPIPVADDAVEDVLRALDDGDPRDLAWAALGPTLAADGLLRAALSGRDPAREERLRWLFGDEVDLRPLTELGAVDDLVTTTYMRGGGFSAAADPIRHAGRQIATGEPPEAWAAARRLAEEGYDRDLILLHLAAAWYMASLEVPDPERVRQAHLFHLQHVSSHLREEQEKRRRAAS